MAYYLLAIARFVIFYLLAFLAGTKIKPVYIYMICTLAFLAGFIFREFHIYPGRDEPLFIDFLTFMACLVLFLLSKLVYTVPLKYGLLIIISVHIVYNLVKIFQIRAGF